MKTEEIKNDSEDLDKRICDYGPTKYMDIVWAMEWARHLRWDDASRHLPMAEMIEKAMLDVLREADPVTKEQIKSAMNKDMSVAGKIAEKKEETKKEKPEKAEKSEKAEKADKTEEKKKTKKA